MADQFANAAQTTINGAITNVAGTLVVTATTGFPTAGPFRCLISAEGANSNELVTVTAVSGATFTITRASEAYAGVQSATAHGDGATITHIVTAYEVSTASIGAFPDDLSGMTIANEYSARPWQRIKLTGATTLTITGTGQVWASDFSAPIATPTVYLGTPKTPSSSFTVPTEWFLDQIARMSLIGLQRATLIGTALLVITDDFGTRSRIVLAGRGF